MPLLMGTEFKLKATLITNNVVEDNGVTENVSVESPFDGISGNEPIVDVAKKSMDEAVVAPLTPDAEMVQTILIVALAGLRLVQVRLEAVVGVPKTLKLNAPLVIGSFVSESNVEIE
jgi:hypothetical protein